MQPNILIFLIISLQVIRQTEFSQTFIKRRIYLGFPLCSDDKNSLILRIHQGSKWKYVLFCLRLRLSYQEFCHVGRKSTHQQLLSHSYWSFAWTFMRWSLRFQLEEKKCCYHTYWIDPEHHQKSYVQHKNKRQGLCLLQRFDGSLRDQRWWARNVKSNSYPGLEYLYRKHSKNNQIRIIRTS